MRQGEVGKHFFAERNILTHLFLILWLRFQRKVIQVGCAKNQLRNAQYESYCMTDFNAENTRCIFRGVWHKMNGAKEQCNVKIIVAFGR